MTLMAFVFPKLWTRNLWLDKCLKRLVSENPWTSNMADVLKHRWNLHHIMFIIFIEYWEVNWIGKTLSYWHEESWDWLLTQWLPMKSIVFLIETISRYEFRCNYLRNKKLFINFWLHFWNLYQILNILKKSWPS